MNTNLDKDRSSYLDITKNPDVESFLEECEYLHEPSDNDLELIRQSFVDIQFEGAEYSKNIIALDADFYESKVRKEIPFTNIGFVKVSNLLLKKKDIEDVSFNKFLDPFQIAQMQKNNESFAFVFPSSNILYKNHESVVDGFRARMDEMFKSIKSLSNEDSLSLQQTLFWLFENKKGNIGSKDIILERCPNKGCAGKNISVKNINELQCCPYCGKPIYATDCLRIWEEIGEDSVSNQGALSRFANVIKSIFLAHYLKTIKDKNKNSYHKLLSETMFVLNSPLAVFGNPAWVHGSLMKIIYDLNNELKSQGYNEIMIIGMHDNTSLSTFGEFIKKDIDNKKLLCVTDEFRDRYINYCRKASSTTFGAETYYGQDFIYKTSKGKIKTFSIPYPFCNKTNMSEFKKEKSNLSNYTNIKNYVNFLEDFDCDMFDNSIIPSVLARKYSIINLRPGTKVLNILSKNNLD